MNAVMFELDEPVFHFTTPTPPSTEVEIRCLVSASCLGLLRKCFDLAETNAVRADVSFHDTPDLLLSRHGVFLRTRACESQLEAKVRLQGTGVPPDIAPFEVEYHIDWNGREQIHSFSRTSKSSTAESAELAATAKCPAHAFFSEAQRTLVETHTPELAGKISWQNVRKFGPAQTVTWTNLSAPQIGRKITIAHWKMRSRWRTAEIIEVSTKAKSLTLRQAADLANEFYRLLELHGFRRDSTAPPKEHRMFHFFRPGS